MSPMKYCPLTPLFPMINSEDGIKHIDDHEIFPSWCFSKKYITGRILFHKTLYWLTYWPSLDHPDSWMWTCTFKINLSVGQGIVNFSIVNTLLQWKAPLQSADNQVCTCNFSPFRKSNDKRISGSYTTSCIFQMSSLRLPF